MYACVGYMFFLCFLCFILNCIYFFFIINTVFDFLVYVCSPVYVFFVMLLYFVCVFSTSLYSNVHIVFI